MKGLGLLGIIITQRGLDSRLCGNEGEGNRDHAD